MSAALLEQFIRETLELLDEKSRKKSAKPGGPRTDIGALRQLNPDKFRNKVRAAVNTHGGDAKAAARELGVAKRTLYYYLDDEKALHTVKTSEERTEEKEKKDKEKAERLRKSQEKKLSVERAGLAPAPARRPREFGFPEGNPYPRLSRDAPRAA